MGVIQKLKATFGGGPEETYTYQCQTCHTTFESTESEVGAVACDGCGSPDVEPVEG